MEEAKGFHYIYQKVRNILVDSQQIQEKEDYQQNSDKTNKTLSEDLINLQGGEESMDNKINNPSMIQQEDAQLGIF
jgi:hypothetical protein